MIKIKKGTYFATASVLLVFFMVFVYGTINERHKDETGITDFGKHSFEIINANLEGEKLKLFVEESVKVSKNIALKNVKENVGVYDIVVSNCRENDGYIVITDECNFNGELAFENYFKDSFGNFLKLYNEGYKHEDFDINIGNGVLSVIGNKRIPLNVEKKGEKEILRYRELRESPYDEDLSNDILVLIEKYSELYDVDENLVKAVIMKESRGRIDAINSNPDSTDHGLMQINDKAHPKFFNENREDFVCDAADRVECNIRAGTSILRENYDRFKGGKTFSCTSRFYDGWGAALRAYNGWGCTGDNNYVEGVLALYGGEIEFDVDEIVEIEEVGFLTANMDFDEDINYDFNKINEVIVRGKEIKECFDNGGDLEICSSRESDFEFVFNVEEGENVLKFDVDEINSRDTIKFALETAQTEVVS